MSSFSPASLVRPMFRYPLTAIATTVALLLAYVGTRYFVDVPVLLALAQLIYLIPPVLATIYTFAAAMAARASSRRRRVWYTLFASAVLLLLSEIIAAWAVVSGGLTSDALEWLFIIAGFFATGMLVLTAALDVAVDSLSAGQRLRLALDAGSFLIATVGSSLLVWSLISRTPFGHIDMGVIEYAADWTIGTSVAVCAMIMWWVAGGESAKPWRMLLHLALLSFALAIMSTPISDVLGFSSAFERFASPSSIFAFLAYALLYGSAVSWLHGDRSRGPLSGGLHILATATTPTFLVAFYVLAVNILIAACIVAGWLSPIMSDIFTTFAMLSSFTLVVSSWLAESQTSREHVEARVDATTGALGLRTLEEDLKSVSGVALSEGRLLMIASIDPDAFARLNAARGYRYGDEILRQVRVAIAAAVGSRGEVYRSGGDSFVVIALVKDAQEARVLADTMLSSVQSVPVHDGTLRCSIGWALGMNVNPNAAALASSAAGARMWAKLRGGGVAVEHSDEVEFVVSQDRGKTLLHEPSVGDIVGALMMAADQVDPHHHDHARSVAVYACMLAEELGMDARQIRAIEAAALLHDIGIIGTAEAEIHVDGVVPAPAEQDDGHPAYGSRIAEALKIPGVPSWVRSHHERWDGTGFPDGLEGEDIPLEARIIALADAYDNLTSPRGHSLLSRMAAHQSIDLDLGTRYDPVLGDRFLNMVGHLGMGGRSDGGSGGVA